VLVQGAAPGADHPPLQGDGEGARQAVSSTPTALMCAAEKGHAHVAKLLLERRADPAARLPSSGTTALDLARKGKHEGVTRLLEPVTPVDRFEQGL